VSPACAQPNTKRAELIARDRAGEEVLHPAPKGLTFPPAHAHEDPVQIRELRGTGTGARGRAPATR